MQGYFELVNNSLLLLCDTSNYFFASDKFILWRMTASLGPQYAVKAPTSIFVCFSRQAQMSLPLFMPTMNFEWKNYETLGPLYFRLQEKRWNWLVKQSWTCLDLAQCWSILQGGRLIIRFPSMKNRHICCLRGLNHGLAGPSLLLKIFCLQLCQIIPISR